MKGPERSSAWLHEGAFDEEGTFVLELHFLLGKDTIRQSVTDSGTQRSWISRAK